MLDSRLRVAPLHYRSGSHETSRALKRPPLAVPPAAVFLSEHPTSLCARSNFLHQKDRLFLVRRPEIVRACKLELASRIASANDGGRGLFLVRIIVRRGLYWAGIRWRCDALGQHHFLH